jgi:hypothetical protein
VNEEHTLTFEKQALKIIFVAYLRDMKEVIYGNNTHTVASQFVPFMLKVK